jgi:hypothetical protein
MPAYLTIPGVTEGEELVAFTHHDAHSFQVTLPGSPTGTWLFQAAAQGTSVELMVLTLDSGMLALDDVLVTSAHAASEHGSDLMAFSLEARAVRFV